MTNCRDIYDVHNKIINYIPPSYNSLKVILEQYIDSLFNQELIVRMNAQTYITYMNILIKNIPNYTNLTDDEPIWKFKIRNIFAGIDEDE
jgi:hypothetical protein